MSKAAKVITAIILSVLMLFSAVSIGLNVLIIYFLPIKTVEQTLYAGDLAGVADEDDKWIITIDYWANNDNTGVELLDIQFSNYMDIDSFNTDKVYKKGMQIVGAENGSISFIYDNNNGAGVVDGWWHTTHYEQYRIASDTYFYDTSNGTSFQSLDKISNDNIFKISIGTSDNAELWGMKFLGFDGEPFDKYNVPLALFWEHEFKLCYDINYFAYLMYKDVVQSNSQNYDADGYLQVDMKDGFNSIFTFAKYENGGFSKWLTSKEEVNGKLKTDFNNYFTIRLKTHSTGAKLASNSLFGMIGGNANFEVVGAIYADDYFVGVQAIILDEYDFEYTQKNDTSYYADLTEKAIAKLEQYKNNDISIQIDFGNLNSIFDFENLEFRVDEKYKARVIESNLTNYTYQGVTE